MGHSNKRLTLYKRVTLLLLLAVAIQITGNHLLGTLLTDLFEKETKSNVVIDRAWLNFFTMKGSLYDVSFRHNKESEEEGITADKVSVYINPLGLFFKRVWLYNLRLEGTRVVSYSDDSSFHRLIKFILRPPPVNNNPPWHSFISDGWKTSLREFSVETPKDDKPSLILKYPDVEFHWNYVRYESFDLGRNLPEEINIYGTKFIVKGLEKKDISLGTLRLAGGLSKNGLLVREGEFLDRKNSIPSSVKYSGYVSTDDIVKLSLKIQADVTPSYLRDIGVEFFEEKDPYGAKVFFQGKISGEIVSPTLSGDFKFSFNNPPAIPNHPACSMKSGSGFLVLSTNELKITDIKSPELFETGSLELLFDENFSIKGNIIGGLNHDTLLVQNCLKDLSVDKDEAFSILVRDVFMDSKAKANFSGTISPLKIFSDIEAELRADNYKANSKIKSKLKLTSKILEVELEERGRFPQILTKQKNTENDAVNSNELTSFSVAINSNIDAQLNFPFNDKESATGNIKLSRFPVNLLLSRVAPFVSGRVISSISDFTSKRSLVDGVLNMRFNESGISQTKGRINLSSPNIFDVSFNNLSFSPVINNQQINFKDVDLSSDFGNLKGEIEIINVKKLRGKGIINISSLQKLKPWNSNFPELDGEGELSLDISGTVLKPLVKIKGNIFSNIGDGILERRISKVDISLQDEVLNAALSVLDGTAEVSLSHSFNEAHKGSKLEAVLDKFPYELLFSKPTSRQETPATVSGNINLSSQTLSPLRLHGGLTIQALGVGNKDNVVESSSPLRIKVEDSKFNFTDVSLKLLDKSLLVKGFVDLDDGWNASISGNWELAQIFSQFGPFEQFSGVVSTKLNVEGNFLKPTISGPLSLKNGSISFLLGGTIVGAEDVALNAVLKNDSIIVDKIIARVGDGTILGEGKIDKPLDLLERSMSVSFSLDKIFLEPFKNAAAEFNGYLNIDYSSKLPLTISGEITIDNGFYRDVINLEELLAALTDTILGSSESSVSSPGFKTRGEDTHSPLFDIHFLTKTPMLVETNIANVKIDSNIFLKGTLEDPKLIGETPIRSGEFSVGSKKFQVINGKISFLEKSVGIDPKLNIVGETTLASRPGDEHKVRMVIAGTVANPEVTFSSDRGIPQDEIASLLGVGTRLSELSLIKGSGTQRSIAELLNPISGISLRDRLSGLTSFSDISIDSAVSSSTGEVVPKVSVRRAVARDLWLTLQTEFNVQQDSAIVFEYPLTPYWSLLSGWKTPPVTTDVDSTTGSFNAGIHFRKTFPGFKMYFPQTRYQESE